jgi:hypothetical protein
MSLRGTKQSHMLGLYLDNEIASFLAMTKA